MRRGKVVHPVRRGPYPCGVEKVVYKVRRSDRARRVRVTVDATRVGELQFGINDDVVEDNSGLWTVRIKTTPPR